MKHDIATMRGEVHIIHRDIDGTLLSENTVKNTITTTGRALISLLIGQAGTAATYLAVGSSNTAPAIGNTALGAEITTNGFGRHVATVAQATTTTTNDTATWSYIWTASGSSTIEEVGIFNASSNGTMVGRALTGSKSMTSGQSLQITYLVIFA